MASRKDRDLAVRVRTALELTGWRNNPHLTHLPELILRHGTAADEWPRSASMEPGSRSSDTTSPTERAALATRSDHTPVELAIAARAVLHAIDDHDRAIAAVRRVLNPRASLPGHEGEAMPCRYCHKNPVRYAGGLIQLCEAHEKAWRVHDRPIHPDGTVDVDTLRARIDAAAQAARTKRTKKKGK